MIKSLRTRRIGFQTLEKWQNCQKCPCTVNQFSRATVRSRQVTTVGFIFIFSYFFSFFSNLIASIYTEQRATVKRIFVRTINSIWRKRFIDLNNCKLSILRTELFLQDIFFLLQILLRSTICVFGKCYIL